LSPFFFGKGGEVGLGCIDAVFRWRDARGGIVNGKFVRSVDLFGPFGDSTLRLGSSLRAVAGKVSHLSALKAHCVIGGSSGRTLRISTLSGSSSHWVPSSWWGLRAVEIHGDRDICVGRWGCRGVVSRGVCILSPIRILVPAISTILLIRQVLEPTSLVVALVSLLWIPMRTEDIFYHLSRFDALNRFLFGSFIGVRDRGSEDIFDYAPRKAFYEEFDGFRVCKVVTCNSGEAFEVVCVLVDFRPFQAEGFQLCSSVLLTLGVLVLGCEFREELFPDGWDVVDWLESVDLLSHGSGPLCYERSLNKREGKGDLLNIRPHARHLAVESDIRLQLVNEVVCVHTIPCEDRGERAHHFHILGLLSGLLRNISIRWGWWSSSTSSSPTSCSTASSSSTSSSCPLTP